jgi:hypothetical protein
MERTVDRLLRQVFPPERGEETQFRGCCSLKKTGGTLTAEEERVLRKAADILGAKDAALAGKVRDAIGKRGR